MTASARREPASEARAGWRAAPLHSTPDPGRLFALSLTGLDVSLELSGEVPARLLAELVGCAPPVATPTLRLHLRLRPGFAPTFDPLTISRTGEGFACRGDGLSGTIDDDEARLDVFGGFAAATTALRLVCALWLAPRGGLLLHGACVEARGAALGLCGPSGAGKSTLARRLSTRGMHVVSDEVLCVRALTAFGHPFPRRLGDGVAPAGGLPLRALGFLSHSAFGVAPSTTRLCAAQAARSLLSRVFLPVKDARLLDGVLASVERLSRAVPAFSLSVPNDDRAASAALALLKDAP